MTFPTPETVDVLAEVSEYLTDGGAAFPGNVETIKSLAQYAGAADRARSQRRIGLRVTVDADAERIALVKLAAHAVARIQRLDRE